MRIRFKHNSEIDRAKWDECIAASMNAEVYGNVWFLDLIAKDWHGLILDDYRAVMPIVTGKKMGFSYVYQTPFFQRTAIYRTEGLNEELVDSFYQAIPTSYKLQEFNVDATSKPGAPLNYEVKSRPNLVLTLDTTYDELKKSYSTNTKRNLKKGEKQQLKIVSSGDSFKMIESYKNNRGKIARDLDVEDYIRLENLINYCVLNETGEILEAHHKNGLFAGGIFIMKGYKRHILLFMGANELSKETGAMFALIDFYLKNNAGTNILFDFEGSADPGVARFYTGFGAIEEKYFAIRKDQLNKLISFAKHLKNKFKT